MSGELPPLYGSSHDIHGAYCVVSAVAWACVTGIVAAIRFVLAWQRGVKFGRDDITFAIAAVFAIASVALYPVAVDAGLGKHIDQLDAQSVSRYFKVIYAAQLLGIIAIACGKASAAFLVQRIALLKLRYLHAFLAVVAAWTVFSLLATAFQCHLPYPWILEPSNCPTRGYLQYVVTAVNMITDVILSTWVIGPVWKIEMVQRDRLLVIFLFGVRIIIPCVAVGQLIFLTRVIKSSDQTWVNVSLALFNQAIFNLSVILTAFPRVNGILYGLQDDILFPQISRRELGQLNLRAEESQSSASPPTGTDSNASSHNAKTETRLKAWKRQVIMCVWEHKSNTPSDHGAVEGCNTSAETNFTGSQCRTLTNSSS